MGRCRILHGPMGIDYARYSKQEDSKFLSWFNFSIPFYIVAFFLIELAGIYLVSTIPLEGEVSEVSITLGLVKLMGVFGLIFVVVTQTMILTASPKKIKPHT